VFEVGKTNGIPFYRNKASGWFLAINANGHVYMAVRKTEGKSLLRSSFASLAYSLGRERHLSRSAF